MYPDCFSLVHLPLPYKFKPTQKNRNSSISFSTFPRISSLTPLTPPHNLNPLAGRIPNPPVNISLPRKIGASIPTAHRDNNVTFLNGFARKGLWFLTREVDSLFQHGFLDDRVYGGRWGGAGGVDLDGVAGEVGEVGCGYLGAAGIVDAEKEDGWGIMNITPVILLAGGNECGTRDLCITS
ncbi:uncharacterized protein EURHEDRAFT_401572 [Aspergillus ruber CBS 135680]|uniref:Uncharacterized protein n=1 Tax=Aspergillus ruber (strain CBS 135680) TaxID=1388766 RepID=A0A017SJM2_ASPRC|nr:uncharacterized protein EURHEDRAFT_401572 [Aspergillus ruber CBS 135680]EYE96505.1 hypothetical protein EURHEDRAFT_401572 [Aspergillus ruber CBS 135680]